VTELVDTIHIKLYEFLDDHGHHDQLEEKFKRKYFHLLNYSFFEQHHCHKEIINKCVRLTIFKYLRDNKNGKRTATTVTCKVDVLITSIVNASMQTHLLYFSC
jgi:hypothetical protein